tara:strand:- start:594 stop:1043 length:450 start_codon:yes stop_codon:yes gene_type:complete
MSVKQLIKYGLNAEVEFLFALNEKFDDEDIIITKTANQYSPVDFVITNKRNDNKLFIELKSRKLDISKFNTFFIGRSKLNQISKNYKTDCVILVWMDTYKHLYYKLFSDELLDCNIKNCNGADCFLINRADCRDSSITALADCIKQYHA